MILTREETTSIRGRDLTLVILNRLKGLAKNFLKVVEKDRGEWRKGFKGKAKVRPIAKRHSKH